MVKYVLGFFVNLFNPAISLFAIIDYRSIVNRKARIWRFVRFVNSSIGKYSYVGPSTRIVYTDIGRYCSIAGDCLVGVGIHTLTNLSTSSLFTAKKNGTRTKWVDQLLVEEYKRVKIGNDVWIGTHVIIMGGVSIGDGAVIGAGAVVTKDIPPYAIAVGIPAKVIKYRFEDNTVNELLRLKWWNLPDNVLLKNITVFQKESWNCIELNSFDYA